MPGFSVVGADFKTFKMKFSKPLLHFRKVTFTVKISFRSNCVHFREVRNEERMFIQKFQNHIYLMQEMIFFSREVGGIKEVRLFSETRREHEFKFRMLF